MSRQQDFFQLRRRICSLDLDPRRSDSFKFLLERNLRFLPNISWANFRNIEDPKLVPCDLLVVYAWHLSEKELITWLQSFEKRIKMQNAIWIPALIISHAAPDHVEELLEYTISSNWYFDILHPDHVASIPIRVGNLLRIHDHLHELERYETEMERMRQDIEQIQSELAKFQKSRPVS